MRTPFIFLLLLAVVASCAPEPDPPNRQDNALTHEPASKQLSVAAPTYTAQVKLVCGCRFVLHQAGAGDTSIIKYNDAMPADSAFSHDIVVSASTTGVPAGTYTSWLALWCYDWEEGVLRDTLYDTLVVQ